MLDDDSCRLRFTLISVVTLMLAAGNARIAGAAPQDGRTDDEHQPGSFAVGHSVRLLNVRGTLGENRPVNVHLWYPARSQDDCGDSNGSSRSQNDQGCSATPSRYTSRLFGVSLGGKWAPLSWTIGSSRSFENLPIDQGHRPFPVIVFSHGHQNNVIDYVYTLEDLASAGFIVAAPDHVNDTQDDVSIDFINSQAGSELILCFDGLAPPCARTDVPKSLTDRVHDISAVIDALPTWFGDRADISRWE
jgi:predicted dienelactone hydrolase